MVEDWFIGLVGHSIFWIGIPSLFLLCVFGPFFYVFKTRRYNSLFVSILVSALVSTGLLSIFFFAIYWTAAGLQGMTYCQIYISDSSFKCFQLVLESVLKDAIAH